jgi:uncharacterized membrane protein YagU involved in acid resistance
MTRNWGKAIVAGLIGTLVMTVVGLYVAPLMGLEPMNPAVMLAGQMGGNMMLGWIAHFMIGIILAVIYAIVAPSIPGAPVVRGALFGIAPWLFAMVIMMPMMGMPMFMGAMMPALGSLMGHVIFGAVVGAIYGYPDSPPAM